MLFALPIFALVIIIANLDFSVIWRFFGWSNQTLSCFTLWTLAVLLRKRGRWHWVVTLPALFMTMVCICFLLSSPDCMIEMDPSISIWISSGVTLLLFALFLRTKSQKSGKVQS